MEPEVFFEKSIKIAKEFGLIDKSEGRKKTELCHS